MKTIIPFLSRLVVGFLLIALPIHAKDKPVVVGKLTGQLGNQMFVIAAAVSLAFENGATPIFPDLLERNEDNTQLNYKKVFFRLNSVLPKKTKIKAFYEEPYFHYAAIPYKKNICIKGYFQSEKYFQKHKEAVVDLFAPSQEILDHLQNKYSDILHHPLTVSVHVRYYLPTEQHVYPFNGRQYIEAAMEQFPEDALFVVFSNDIAASKVELYGLSKNICFIEGNSYYHDFYLMSLCTHNIISNSSFSWWAAYLNKNPEKIVITPSAWFTPESGINAKDLIPAAWITIRN